jgi:hypothetical protein
MSYNLNNEHNYTSTKLTDKGREKLAKGKLNFNNWILGDSEIDYQRESLIIDEVISGDTIISRPFDNNPNIRYKIVKSDGTISTTFGDSDIKCIKAVVNNKADKRGIFNGDDTNGFDHKTTDISDYIVGHEVILSGNINGTNTITTTINANEGDILKLVVGDTTLNVSGVKPVYFFKVVANNGGVLTLDRNLPNIVNDSYIIIYKGGDISDNEADQIAYWDNGTLSFDSSCNITVKDVPIWNQTNIVNRDILGIDNSIRKNKSRFSSNEYSGQKELLFDGVKPKMMSIIHYTNKTISNLYGEALYINASNRKAIYVELPTIMYHRRDIFNNGLELGMKFVSDTNILTTSNGLRYVNLLEDISYVTNPTSVGRIYLDLKIIVFTDEEIVTTFMYKSNRSWTLPSFNLELVNPDGGVNTGVLNPNQTLYFTYELSNSQSSASNYNSLPSQKYSTIINTSNTSKDVQFNMEDVDLLQYLSDTLSGDGFIADSFNIIYQIVDNGIEPTSDGWVVSDFTTSVNGGNTLISSSNLEVQNPNATTPKLQITTSTDSNSTNYVLHNDLHTPIISDETSLNYGDEKFFNGNVDTYISATIFKTLFKMVINTSDYSTTNNPSKTLDINPNLIKASEIGIYDDEGDLILIGKLSKPLNLSNNDTIIIEISIDF